jgi:hypothetical protein
LKIYSVTMAALCGILSQGVSADEPSTPVSPVVAPLDLNQLATHTHQAIIVRSRPVIERLPVQVIQPVDLQVGRTGNIFVADAQAACVFRLDQFGSVSLHAQQLPGLKRIVLDADENAFVLSSGSADCQIHQVTPEGQRILLHSLRFAAHCICRAGADGWMVAGGHCVWLVTADNEPQQIAQFAVPVIDLCGNTGGGTSVLLADGRVLQLGLDGAARAIGVASGTARRLICQPDGQLAVLSHSRAAAQVSDSPLPLGLYPIAAGPSVGEVSAIAHLPEGTQAAGFDSLGNLCLANPQLRAITRVTSRFRIPCPHCGQPVPMIFDASARPENVSGF